MKIYKKEREWWRGERFGVQLERIETLHILNFKMKIYTVEQHKMMSRHLDCYLDEVSSSIQVNANLKKKNQ